MQRNGYEVKPGTHILDILRPQPGLFLNSGSVIVGTTISLSNMRFVNTAGSYVRAQQVAVSDVTGWGDTIALHLGGEYHVGDTVISNVTSISGKSCGLKTEDTSATEGRSMIIKNIVGDNGAKGGDVRGQYDVEETEVRVVRSRTGEARAWHHHK